MIVKESTNLGKLFLNACFQSLKDSQYPNEIVLIENGSTKDIFEEVYEPWTKTFKEMDIDLRVIPSDLKYFGELRNACIQNTNPKADWFHWMDSDESYYPEDLDSLRNYVLEKATNDGITLVWSYFYHLMIHPWQVQCNPKQMVDYKADDIRSFKDNIFKFTKNVKFDKPVHEKLTGRDNQNSMQSNTEYIHMGYLRQQWRTSLKWLHYDMLEHGHVGGYKLENIEVDEDGNNILDTHKPKIQTIQKDYFRDWRNPNNVLWDRNSISVPWPNPAAVRMTMPDGVNNILAAVETPNQEGWDKFLDKLDGNEFWHRWQAKHDEVGNWRETLDWVVSEAERVKWNLI